MSYRTVDVQVRGGGLRVGVWESAGLAPGVTARLTVLLVHGITSSHLVWSSVAERLVERPGTRLIAPDLRGRGRSHDLPGPWGMRVHADDLRAVTGRLGRPDLTAGHSMGGFVAVVAAHRYPDSVGKLLLVDGGVPLPLPIDDRVDLAVQRLLGPTAARLAMRFADREAYRRWWRAQPAFAGGWSPTLDAYVDYDLVPDDQSDTVRRWRSASRIQAVEQDFPEQGTVGVVPDAWTALAADTQREVLLLRAPLGLQAEPPGLYPADVLDRFAASHAGFRWIEIPDTNHYTVVLGDSGARQVAAAIIDQLAVAAVSDVSARAAET